MRPSDCVATCHRSNAAAEGHDRQHHLRATGDAVAGLQGVAAAHGRRAGALDIRVGRPREAQLEHGPTAASATGGVRGCRAQLAGTIAVLRWPERLLSEEGDPILLDCVLETDGESALARRLSRTGPADAQGQDAGESEEEEPRDGAPVEEDAGILDGFLCCDKIVCYKQLFVFVDQYGRLVKLVRCYNFSKLT